MPYSIDVHPQHRLGIARLSGLITGETIAAVSSDLYTHNDWQTGFNAVWDCREIDELVVTESEVIAFVDQLSHLDPYAGEGCTAIIVNSGMHYELAKLIEVKLRDSHRQRRVFRSFDAGIAWLLAMGKYPGEILQRSVRQLSALAG